MADMKECFEDNILRRARRAAEEGQKSYARFLLKEAIDVNPQNIEAREALYKLRASTPVSGSFFDKIKIAFYTAKLLVNKQLSKYDDVIRDAEHLLDCSPKNSFAFKQILRAAYSAGYFKLAIFVEDMVRESEYDIEDILLIAKSYLEAKIFDKATKIAKEAAELDPDNEEAKEILWKSSVEKHMNSDVQLVTAGEGKRFVPPKIDAEKIFISSHKGKDKDKEKEEEKDKKHKEPVKP